MRQDGAIEGALLVKHEGGWKNKGRNYPPCKHCNKLGHPPFKCWRRLDAKCNKCNQLGHETIICRNQSEQKDVDAQFANEEEDVLFVAIGFCSNISSASWLIDSGCTNHMTHDKELFKELRTTDIKRVRIGNGEHLAVKGKGTIAITSYKGIKIITNVLFVPEIDQNLLSVGQLLEKGYKVMFENKHCLIKDVDGSDLFKVEMKGKSFALNPMEEEHIAFKSKENVTEIYVPDLKNNILSMGKLLESVEAKFNNLEKRFTKLEEKYVDMEKDKESRVNQVEELHLLLLAQKEKVNELQFKLKAPFGSCVLLENNGFDLGEDHKWNGVETSSEREIRYNHYLRNSLKSKSFLNPFNSKGKSGEDFVWKIKSNSIQNSARISAMKKILKLLLIKDSMVATEKI
ncbi:uncharacterized protein [Phaseolus vulgaris]|uniref:uncharacterized protein n=1 Tax=Phaseolus vulgaris TaxID=3885 RepID=UPI0035CB3291